MSSANEPKEYGDYTYPSSGQPWSHTGPAPPSFPHPPSQHSHAEDSDHQSNGQNSASMAQTSQHPTGDHGSAEMYPGDQMYLTKEGTHRPHYVPGTLPPSREPHSFQHPSAVHRPYFGDHRWRTPNQGGRHPVPGSRPPFGIDFPRPPFMHQDPRHHRLLNEGQLRGFRNEGSRPRFLGRQRPPFPMDNRRPPFPVDGPRPSFEYIHGSGNHRLPHNSTSCIDMGESDLPDTPSQTMDSQPPYAAHSSQPFPLKSTPTEDWNAKKSHDNVPYKDLSTTETGLHGPSLDSMAVDGQKSNLAPQIPGEQISKEEPPAKLRCVATNQRDLDANWVKAFTTSRQKHASEISEQKAQHAEKSISISEVQNLLKEALVLKKELKNLMKMAHSNPESVHEIHATFEQIRTRLQEIEGVLTDEENNKLLHRKLALIRKKRDRIRRHRESVKQEQEEIESRRKEIGARIDQSQASAVQKLAGAKKADELKNAADSILGEVRKKQTDAKRGLDLLKALTKLRDVRKEKASQKGMYTSPQADDKFNERSKELEILWQKQLDTYQEEQRVLEVMMEVEHEENREKELEKVHRKEERILRVFSRNLRHSFFGPNVADDAADPINSYRQYYKSSSHTLDNLIQIRREWDMFLASEQDQEASSLPQGWVVPPAPSGPIWASALKTKPS